MTTLDELGSLRTELEAVKKERDHAEHKWGELLTCQEQLAAVTKERDELAKAIERMRIAGGSAEFHMAFELAKDALAKLGADKGDMEVSTDDTR